MATGEVIGAEELGGADVHGNLTGLADQVASDEFDAIRKAREWVSSLARRKSEIQSLQKSVAPRFPKDDFFSLVDPEFPMTQCKVS